MEDLKWRTCIHCKTVFETGNHCYHHEKDCKNAEEEKNMNEYIWVQTEENEEGIKTMALEPILGTDYYRTVGFNGILKGDRVVYQNEEYTVVMVSRLGEFGLSLTDDTHYTVSVRPLEVYSI